MSNISERSKREKPWLSGDFRRARQKKAAASERKMMWIIICFWIFALLY